MHFSYSVIIRTLGDSGDKYESLLRSISKQTIPPEEIIVAIPKGFELDRQLGTERIIRAAKGMVSQRAEGIAVAKSKYLLVCDDDIEFGDHFVEGLYRYLQINNLDCVLPMSGALEDDKTDALNLRYPFLRRLRCAFTGQMFQTRKYSAYLDVISTTAGHTVFLGSNHKDTCYYCETGNFQCFFIDAQKAKAVHFADEVWLQQGSLSSYSAYDDPSFFYKFYLQGGSIAYSLRSRYVHLDAGSGRKAKSKLEEKTIRYFSTARNRTVFWYRFLWLPSKNFPLRRLAVLLGGLYGTINYTLLTITINIFPKYWESLRALFTGYAEAFRLIKSQIPTGLKFRPRTFEKF